MRLLTTFGLLAIGILGLYYFVERESPARKPAPAALLDEAQAGVPVPVMYLAKGEVEFLLRPFHIDAGRAAWQRKVWSGALAESPAPQFLSLWVANHGADELVLPADFLASCALLDSPEDWALRGAEDLRASSEHLLTRWRALAFGERRRLGPKSFRRFLVVAPTRPEFAIWTGLESGESGETWSVQGISSRELIRFESKPQGRWSSMLRPRTKPGKLSAEKGSESPRDLEPQSEGDR